MTNKDTDSIRGRKVGFIGLGLMGKPMARHLLDAGAELTVANRSSGALDELVAAGAACAGSPGELGALLAGETVVLMLKNADVVREVAEGEGGLLGSLGPGSLVIDMGTTSLGVTRWLGGELEARGCRLVDAPVSGGQTGAEAGNLTVMAGGDEEDFARALPVLQVVGERITRMGGSGSGQVTKLANQIIVATTIDAVAEALRFASAAGVDPALVREALRGGWILPSSGRRCGEGSPKAASSSFRASGWSGVTLSQVGVQPARSKTCATRRNWQMNWA